MNLKSNERAFALPAATRGGCILTGILFFTNANSLPPTRATPSILAFL